ncbi:glycosyltransferase family 4 protein [Parapedobacter deserti]|uniref:Glycosyltransferase family 4 protein n=1 Tax=Parapedobacter deserti TaxID=1912957 RepID=A0ABV7JQQ9_9SPHI
MKRFLTIFPQLRNVHLTKDVGMIPYFLQREQHYDCTIACFGYDQYPYLEQEVQGLKLKVIKRLFKSDFLNLVLFIFSEHKKYDVLQMYHYSRDTLLLLYLFKALGLFRKKTYLKLDADDRIRSFKFGSGPSGLIARFLFRSISLVSIESKPLHEYLNNDNHLGRKITYIPNGFHHKNGEHVRVDYGEKSNLIVSVGRLGSRQKATELVCEAFTKFVISQPDWILMLIGTEEPVFSQYLDDLMFKHPFLHKKIKRLNEVTDRNLLMSYYKQAKMLVLPSRWEGFPLVYVEAISSGCYVITTPVSAGLDVTRNGELGVIVPFDSVDEIAYAMLDYAANESHMRTISSNIQNYAYQQFWWPRIVEKISEALY